MKKIIIIGTSSTAKTVYEFIRTYNLYQVIGFAINEQFRKDTHFCELPIFSIEQLDTTIDKKKDFVFVAIQWNNLNADRRKIYEKLKDNGFQFANLISPTAIVNGSIKGKNCWIADQVLIDFNTTISNNVFIKVGAMIGPNSHISNHCFIGAKSIIAGGVKIDEQSFVGLSAVIFDGVKIGKKCIVGAATALKRNLDNFSIYKTNIENYITKQYTEDIIETKLQFTKNIRK